MTATVYAWPPVAPSSWEWTVAEPVDTSRSLLTGRRYASAAQRRRRVARMAILGHRGDQGGYMEALKRLLQGGANLVRLTSRPMISGASPDAATRSAARMIWTAEDEPLQWASRGEAVAWFAGASIVAAISTAGALPAAQIGGLPVNARVGRVGETITVYPDFASYAGAQTRILLRELRSDASGVALAVLDAALTVTGRCDIGVESGVFEAVSMPRPVVSIGQGWTYDWDFVEVFEDEVGGFVEVNPW